MKLKLYNWDTSKWWNRGGNTGIYMAVGFGSRVMKGSDITSCKFVWANGHDRYYYDDWSYPPSNPDN